MELFSKQDSDILILQYLNQLYLLQIMRTLQMLAQQNLAEEQFDELHLKSTPIISKIENESFKFKTLVSHLRNQKRKGEQPQFCNDSEISNIQHRSERCSFDIQLPMQSGYRKPASIGITTPFSRAKDQGDMVLKYKPRSTINGRDQYRIRSVNPVHKKIIDSFKPKRRQAQQLVNNHFPDFMQKLSQPNMTLKNKINPINMHLIQNHSDIDTDYLNKSSVRKLNQTQKLRGIKNLYGQKQTPYHESEMEWDVNPEKDLDSEQFVNRIEPKALIKYLNKISELYPSNNSTPSQIYNFFSSICSYFGFKDYFVEPLIKRYQNCIYFGQKISKSGKNSYIGFVWYYRKTLYYGNFLSSKKHGYGIQIDIEQPQNQCVWRGNFLSGKKTGYFHIKSSNLQYNGTLKNSYFDGQGQLKTNKSSYKGYFQTGMKAGSGIQHFTTKSLTYRGQYQDNKFDGNGQLQGPNYFYKGYFRAGKAHGSGFQRIDDYEYSGEFKNGKKNGRGTLKMSNGEVTQGIFQQGKIISKHQDRQPETSHKYSKNLAIQSAQKNLVAINWLKKEEESMRIKPLNGNKESRNKQTPVLQKYLSKQLHALHEQNEEGTIEQQKERETQNHRNGFDLFQVLGNQSDEDEPLKTKILPL